MRTNKNKVVDVLIIGDGIAGCIAALAAYKQRADVMIIEKSQPSVPHGNTGFCGGDGHRIAAKLGGQALDVAVEAMEGLDWLNAARCEAGKPIAAVDLSLHVGEVLYGNVGAVDRLDFTVIGPAVNEVARIEALCEPLGRKVLISAELASVVGDRRRLEPLGYHTLRGVRDPREIYGLDLGSKA
jgi:class 3 adenylate cyclase